jgi:Skp family chaperone for outer membrane proteins
MNRFAVFFVVAFAALSASVEAQIGFIDFQKCFEEYKKADAQIKEQEKLLEAEKAKIRIAEGKIVAMRDNLDLLTDGSPDQAGISRRRSKSRRSIFRSTRNSSR